MNLLTLTPEAALPGLPLPTLDQVWVAARAHVLRYAIHGPERFATWQMAPGTCFLALDVAADESHLRYVPSTVTAASLPMPVIEAMCHPRHRMAARVWDELPEADLVVVARFTGTDHYIVHGLEAPLQVQLKTWPKLSRQGNAYCALTMGTTVPQASAQLPPSLAYTLHGRLPFVESANASLCCGVFQNQVLLQGQHLYGTRRVWWGATACEFTTVVENDQYALLVSIPAGNQTAQMPFKVMNQAGTHETVFTYRRF